MTKRISDHANPATQTEFEKREAQIYQSTNVKELRSAYREFLRPLRSQGNLVDMLALAGPAQLVSLTLRGYEMPDARTRYESGQVLLALDEVLNSINVRESITEQYWLMMAQQREVLLDQIEADIEALVDSAMPEEETKKREQVLYKLHKLVYQRTEQAIRKLVGVEQGSASFAS